MRFKLQSALLSLLVFTNTTPFTTASTPVTYPKSITLSYESIDDTSSTPQPLGTISYDPRTLKYQIDSWTPPTIPDPQTPIHPTSSPLLRILLPGGSSTLTSLSTFDTTLTQHVTLLLSSPLQSNDLDTSEIFSVSITSTNPTPLSKEEERLRKKNERLKAKGKPTQTIKPIKTKTKTKSSSTSTSKSKKKAPVNPEEVNEPGVKIHLVAAGPGPIPKFNSRKAPVVDAQGKEIPQQAEQPEKSFFQKYWWVFLIAVALTMGGGGGGEK